MDPTLAAAPHVECAARSTYASPRPGVALHRTADGGTLVVPTRRAPGATGAEPRVGAEFVRHDALHADGYLIDYLALLDGARPRAAIDAEFAGRYGPLFGPMLAERAWDWAVAHPALVDVLPRPLPQPRRAPLTGSPDGFYPLHCSFEIIETCNFTCAHCYYNAAPWKTGRVSLGDARAILDALAANGVRVVELTGGECTVHPDFPEILRHAAATFDLVGIITNGYRVGTHDRTCDAVVATPNVAVQVSIDAIGERHDAFRRHRGAFDAAVTAVRRLRDAGVMTRIASAISAENVDQVVELYELGKALGVERHAFAPVAPLGRGCGLAEPGAGSAALIAAIDAALAPYAGDPALTSYAEIPAAADHVAPARNCGAGWRTVAVDYHGHVRACNYSRESKQLGNVLREPYGSIFSQRASFLFHNAPSPGGVDCAGCAYYAHCRGCFVKAFMVSETQYPGCPWRQRWFRDMPLALDDERHAPPTPASERRRALPVFSDADGRPLCTSCATSA